jgi:hypothetical protein
MRGLIAAGAVVTLVGVGCGRVPPPAQPALRFDEATFAGKPLTAFVVPTGEGGAPLMTVVARALDRGGEPADVRYLASLSGDRRSQPASRPMGADAEGHGLAADRLDAAVLSL